MSQDSDSQRIIGAFDVPVWPMLMRWYQPFLYLWAAPASLVGLSLIPIALLQGGSARIVRGVVEAHGGIITRLLRTGLPWVGSGAAITFGHVVWGCDENYLDVSREHERVHVRQYERWGPLFIPFYLTLSAYAAARGLDPYRDNPFERQAFDHEDRLQELGIERMAPNLRNIFGLIGWLLLCFAAAALGAVASANAPEFYAKLAQPTWAPPAWLFGPVWTVLYAFLAIAAWLVWRERGFRGAAIALALFVIQLAINALWSWLFFSWHLGGLAFAVIVVLWVLIVAMAIAFWRVRPAAGLMLLPYFAWVTFAAVLCYSIWRLNPQLLS